ncbi:hypothetical protein GW17_00001265 [Ensete ventricosum]|nr:hypothetical protein GW17_00001265 [Ensete ventricosum]
MLQIPLRVCVVNAEFFFMGCRIIDYCIRKRLQWNQCFARKVCKEGEYYEEMMRYLRKNLAVCPGTSFLIDSLIFSPIFYEFTWMFYPNLSLNL